MSFSALMTAVFGGLCGCVLFVLGEVAGRWCARKYEDRKIIKQFCKETGCDKAVISFRSTTRIKPVHLGGRTNTYWDGHHWRLKPQHYLKKQGTAENG